MHYVHAVVPNKETVYSDLIAETMPLAPRKIVTQIREFWLPWVIFLEDVLSAARKSTSEHLYNRNNSYWNDLGASFAYTAIMAHLAKQCPIYEPLLDVTALHYEAKERAEGFEKYIGSDAAYFETKAVNLGANAKLRSTNKITNRGRIEIWDNHLGRGRAVVFCDSFTFNVLRRFLREQFLELHLVHSATVDFAYIDNVKPNVVLSIGIERFLPTVFNDWSAASALDIASSLGKA
ncbi:hypothetical protein [Belnapia arida]|uniref:hypothetical protein n=1 Tax=Belnapia arida TaxID=2804533 RepID=UPI001F2A3FF7|nr:hypothetical protein [Belnapia arida]